MVQDGRGGSSNINLEVTVTNDREGIKVTRVTTVAGTPRAMSNAASDGEITVYLEDGQAQTIDGQSGAVASSRQLFLTPNIRLLAAIRTAEATSSSVAGMHFVAQRSTGECFVSFFSDARDKVAETQGGTLTGPTTITPKASIVQIGDSSTFHVAIGVTKDSDAQDSGSDFGKLYEVIVGGFSGASTRGTQIDTSVIGDGIRQPGGAGQLGDETLLADQGASVERELNFYLDNARPLDFGWPDREGSQLLTNDGPAAVNGPTLVYGFGDAPFTGQGIVLGGAYSGSVAELQDRFIFGDLDGSIYSIPLAILTSGFLRNGSDLELRTEDFTPDAGVIDSPVAFATDGLGRFFILDSDGELFRVDAA